MVADFGFKRSVDCGRKLHVASPCVRRGAFAKTLQSEWRFAFEQKNAAQLAANKIIELPSRSEPPNTGTTTECGGEYGRLQKRESRSAIGRRRPWRPHSGPSACIAQSGVLPQRNS